MVHGGECDRKVNMDFSVNLNPLGTPKMVVDAIRKSMDCISKYPEYDQGQLREAIARLENVSTEEIIAGNGASELIMAVVRAVNPGKALLIEPCFYGYRHALNALEKCDIVSKKLDSKKGYTLTEDILDAIQENVDIVFLTNPWNPIGFNIDGELLGQIIEKAKKMNCIVVVDESFYMLSEAALKDRTSEAVSNNEISLHKANSNIYVIRSFTKCLTIPGIRIGYIMSTKGNIRQLAKQLPEWNISVMAEYAGIAGAKLLQNKDYVSNLVEYIRQERNYLINSLRKRKIVCIDSDTVYITIKGPLDLYNKLLEQGILIRDCSNFEGLGTGYYRIAIKDHFSNEKLIEAIDNIF